MLKMKALVTKDCPSEDTKKKKKKKKEEDFLFSLSLAGGQQTDIHLIHSINIYRTLSKLDTWKAEVNNTALVLKECMI